ncbi:MAG: FkbM family methyltransferase [Oleiphilaceae bacterium]|jgi:FkbM family methyltransferase
MKAKVIYFLRLLRRIIKIILKKEYFTFIDCKLANKNFGSDVGGWNIVVNDLDSDSIVLSFGLGEDISFDLELIKSFNLTVHGFDPTPKSIEWIESQKLDQHFILHKFGLADFNGMISFNPPENSNHVSHTLLNRPSTASFSIEVPVKNIHKTIDDLQLDRIDIMKMDIEGAEYGVIPDLKQLKIKPKQLLIEFHHRFPEVGVNKTKNAVAELRAMGYRLFCISPRGEEYSFIFDPNNIL